jgi:hypothetical protein
MMDKPFWVVIWHLQKNTSSKDIIFTVQKLGFNVMSSIQQMTAKCPLSEGPITTTLLPLFFATDMLLEVTDSLLHSLPGVQGSFVEFNFV